MTRWGMVIDLQKCIGCGGCTDICKEANRTPTGASWRQVFTYQDGGGFSAPSLNLPMNCMHCSEPPCLEVCPTTATYRRPDGIVDVHYDLCIGCGYCVVACPYFARFTGGQNQLPDLVMEVDFQATHVNGNDQRGVATKCNFCLPRIESGLARGLEIGVAPEATPTCVAYCAGKALHFGDLNDPTSSVARLVQENQTFQLQEELNTGPTIYYLDGKAVQELPGEAELELVPSRQQDVWGWPAVVNFVLGGMAAGLFLINSALQVFGGQTIGFGWIAPLLAVIGFATLTLEAGRPFRSHNIFRHLRQSWMSREALAGAIFILFALFDWLSPQLVWELVTAVAAVSLMISQGFMVYRARAVAAWNVPLMPFMFATSGFAAGSGLALLLSAGQGQEIPGLALTALVCTALNFILWSLYLYMPRADTFRKATQPLRRLNSLILAAGVGHLLPVLLLAIFWGSPNHNLTLAALAGLVILFGGAVQKSDLILKAGFLRGIRMKRSRSMPDYNPLRNNGNDYVTS